MSLYLNDVTDCPSFSGGESLQREELPHNECPREDTQCPGVSGRSPTFRLACPTYSLRRFSCPQYVSEVVIGAPFAVTKDLLDHFKVGETF